MPRGQIFLLTTEDYSNEMLDDLLTTESKFERLSTSAKSFHPYAQAKNVENLKTNVISITAAKFKDPTRVDKVLH